MLNTYVMGSTQITLTALSGTTFPVKVSAPDGCCGMDVQYVSGGSIMVLPNAKSGSTISGATVPANLPGYLISTTYPLSINGPAVFYLANGSSTSAVVGINFRFSAGASLA
jgi:hypothetical protein